MITAEEALEKIRSACFDEELMQDALWHAGFNFHRFPRGARLGILNTLAAIAPKQSHQTLFWMVIYLISAYFSVMGDDEKHLYLGLLCDLTQSQSGFLLSETFELTGRLFRMAPDPRRPAMLRILLDNVSRGDSQAICSFCEACERVCLELSDLECKLLLAKLNELYQQDHVYYVVEAIEHAIERLKSTEAL